MMKTIALSALATVAMLATNLTMASGSGDYGGNSGYVRIDRLYEAGKAQYYAPDTSGQRIRYCVKDGDLISKVSRKTLRSFSGTSADELSSSLYHCDQPETSISETLQGDQLKAVVYYLNKRYRLGLYGT